MAQGSRLNRSYTETLVRFCRSLRNAGARISIDESISAAAALKEIDPTNKDQFYYALYTSLMDDRVDKGKFDELFNYYWQETWREESGEDSVIKEDVDDQLIKSCTISKLTPGTKINPHSGDIDSLRLHYSIIDDEDAWLSVRGRKKTWKVGRPFAFHDHDKHWAQHNGTHDRIVVIMDYSITQLEKRGVFIEKWEQEPAI